MQHGTRDQPEGQEQEQLLVPEQSKPDIQFFLGGGLEPQEAEAYQIHTVQCSSPYFMLKEIE